MFCGLEVAPMSDNPVSCLPIFTSSNFWSNNPSQSQLPLKGEPMLRSHGSNEHADLAFSNVKAGCSNLPNHGRWVPGGSPNKSEE